MIHTSAMDPLKEYDSPSQNTKSFELNKPLRFFRFSCQTGLAITAKKRLQSKINVIL